jgi:hypothetical protein
MHVLPDNNCALLFVLCREMLKFKHERSHITDKSQKQTNFKDSQNDIKIP